MILASGDLLVAAPFQSVDRVPAVAGPDRHAGAPAVPRRLDQRRGPAGPAHRRAGSRSPAVERFPPAVAGGALRARPAGRRRPTGRACSPDRATGALAGAAVGDALGGAAEGNTPDDIQARYGGLHHRHRPAVPRGLAQRPADRAVPQGRRAHHRRHVDDARPRRRVRRRSATTSTRTPSPSTSCRC